METQWMTAYKCKNCGYMGNGMLPYICMFCGEADLQQGTIQLDTSTGCTIQESFKVPKAWLEEAKPAKTKKKELRGRTPTKRILEIWREVWEKPDYAMDGREAKAAKDCWLFVREREDPYQELEKLFRRFRKVCEGNEFWRDKPHLRTINTCSRQLTVLDNDLHFQPREEGGPKYPDLTNLREQMEREAEGEE